MCCWSGGESHWDLWPSFSSLLLAFAMSALCGLLFVPGAGVGASL